MDTAPRDRGIFVVGCNERDEEFVATVYWDQQEELWLTVYFSMGKPVVIGLPTRQLECWAEPNDLIPYNEERKSWKIVGHDT